jgi:UDP-N-acetylglucosamine:LPS N-acetylglucosamine transferase
VPLPIGNGEQRLNAAAVVEAGGGILVDDADVSADWVIANVVPLLADADRLAAMSAAAAGFGRPDAANALMALVHQVAGRQA